jgi:hypothetical protein
MEALGREFNIVANADDVYVNLRDAGGVTFLGFLAAGDTWTLTEAKDAAGTGAQALTTIERWFSQATPGAAWVLNTLAANSAVTSTASQDVVVIEVEAAELSDTYKYVKLASTSTGTVQAILRDLHVQRKPANLASVIA